MVILSYYTKYVSIPSGKSWVKRNTFFITKYLWIRFFKINNYFFKIRLSFPYYMSHMNNYNFQLLSYTLNSFTWLEVRLKRLITQKLLEFVDLILIYHYVMLVSYHVEGNVHALMPKLKNVFYLNNEISCSKKTF